MKLITFTDKFLQNDLNEKCMDFFTSNMNSDNVYTILDFVRQENIHRLTNWCMKFLKNNLTLQNVSGLVRYIYQQQNNPEFAKANLELKYTAIKFLTNQYHDIIRDGKMNVKFYEDFLIQNIGIDTIVHFANFLYGKFPRLSNHLYILIAPRYTEWYNASDYQPALVNIKSASFAFAGPNFEQLAEKEIHKDLPHLFLSDLILYLVKTKRDPN